jgi:hypothetical protein
MIKELKVHITPATQGGGGISPTFGAALWILDYVMQSIIMGIEVGIRYIIFKSSPQRSLVD